MTLKQKLRKYNKEFEAEIQSFRENPVNSDDERAEPGEWKRLNCLEPCSLQLYNWACSLPTNPPR